MPRDPKNLNDLGLEGEFWTLLTCLMVIVGTSAFQWGIVGFILSFAIVIFFSLCMKGIIHTIRDLDRRS